jgi:hypothetical protein
VQMNKEKYEDLMLRFAKELNDVGVSENLKNIVKAQYDRTPNISGVERDENVRKFVYRHDGYEIEAIQNVKIVVRKCK